MAPEEKSKRGSPVERLRERSRVERKETNSEAEYENQEGKHEKSGRREWGERKKRKWKTSTGKATVRRGQEEQKGRNRRLSSWKWKRSGRKKVEKKRKIQKVKTGSKHLRNGCGSETGKGERKHTAKLSTGIGKERTRNQAGENEENRRSESESGALEKPL